MNHQEFLNKYLGTKLDWDGAYGYQCKDLARGYCNEVLGIDLARGNAWEVYEEKYTKFDNNWVKGDLRNGDKAQEGDVIFSPPTKNNPYGHIAIAHNDHEMIEQNGKTGNGSGTNGDEVRLVPMKKDICVFWRYKKYSNKTPIDKTWEQLEGGSMYKDYNDPTIMTGGQVRKLIEIAFINKKL